MSFICLNRFERFLPTRLLRVQVTHPFILHHEPSATMKRIFAGLSLACLALAIPFYSPEGPNSDSQVQLGQFTAEDYANYPGYDLDLNALRLVQLEGREPVWMTEYEKVRVSVLADP